MTKIIVSNLIKATSVIDYLAKHWNKTESQVYDFCSDYDVYVNDELDETCDGLLKNGDVIAFKPKLKDIEVVSKTQEDININLFIVYEDDDIIVINKPKNLVVHDTKYETKDTLVNLLRNKLTAFKFDDVRAGVVQRLDKNTTGLLVLAKNPFALSNLQEQLSQKILSRIYLAIVHGHLQQHKLKIKVPLKRIEGKSKYGASSDFDAKEAITNVSLLANLANDLALVNCQLETGRTHQIRAHLAYIKHPIYNDDVYGKDDGIKNYHQFLHSYQLSFYHPVSKQYLTFKAPIDKTFVRIIGDLAIIKKYDL